MVENESWAEFVQKLTSIICDGQMWTGRLSPVWPPTSQDGQRWISKRNQNQRPRWQGGLRLRRWERTRRRGRRSRWQLRCPPRTARTTTARSPLSRTSKRSLTLRVSAHDERELGIILKIILTKNLGVECWAACDTVLLSIVGHWRWEGTSPLTPLRGQKSSRNSQCHSL